MYLLRRKYKPKCELIITYLKVLNACEKPSKGEWVRKLKKYVTSNVCVNDFIMVYWHFKPLFLILLNCRDVHQILH